VVRGVLPSALVAWLAAALLGPARVEAAPKIAAFACMIGEGRGIFLKRADEDRSEDELVCRVSLSHLGGRSASDLVAELRIVPPTGPFRVVATTVFESVEGARNRAQLDEVVVPHGTWAPAIDWRRRSPGLRIVLCIRDRPAPGSSPWPLVARKTLDIRHWQRAPGKNRLERLFRWITAR
jgi:hypothetical protein